MNQQNFFISRTLNIIKKLLFVLVSLIIIISCANPRYTILFPKNYNTQFYKIITLDQIEEDDKRILISVNKHDLDQLLNLLNICYVLLETIQMNIFHMNESSNNLENAYKNKYFEFSHDGTYLIKENDNHRFVYNPQHPDAIKDDSNLNGYVVYPSINLKNELRALSYLLMIQNLLVQSCKKINPNLILYEYKLEDYSLFIE